MAVDERQWHALYERAEQVFGADSADTLMALLPPVGWADVATKHDVEQLRADVDQLRLATKSDVEQLRLATKSDLDHLSQSVDQRIETSAQRVINTMTWRMFGMLVATTGLIVGLIAPLSH